VIWVIDFKNDDHFFSPTVIVHVTRRIRNDVSGDGNVIRLNHR